MIIKNILHWFYCLPIINVVLLIALVTLVFLVLKGKFNECVWWKLTIRIMLFICIGMMIYVTIANREISNIEQHSFILFHSYREVMDGGNPEILRSNFMNVVLFYPAGLLSAAGFPGKCSKWYRVLLTLVLFITVSVGIEYVQYVYNLGRVEIDDVFHNTIGALLGGMIGVVELQIFSKKRIATI